MMSGGTGYGGGMMGFGANRATSTESHSGGMMEGVWGMMGDHGVVANGEGFFAGCLNYMEHIFGLGANGRSS